MCSAQQLRCGEGAGSTVHSFGSGEVLSLDVATNGSPSLLVVVSPQDAHHVYLLQPSSGELRNAAPPLRLSNTDFARAKVVRALDGAEYTVLAYAPRDGNSTVCASVTTVAVDGIAEVTLSARCQPLVEPLVAYLGEPRADEVVVMCHHSSVNKAFGSVGGTLVEEAKLGCIMPGVPPLLLLPLAGGRFMTVVVVDTVVTVHIHDSVLYCPRQEPRLLGRTYHSPESHTLPDGVAVSWLAEDNITLVVQRFTAAGQVNGAVVSMVRPVLPHGLAAWRLVPLDALWWISVWRTEDVPQDVAVPEVMVQLHSADGAVWGAAAAVAADIRNVSHVAVAVVSGVLWVFICTETALVAHMCAVDVTSAPSDAPMVAVVSSAPQSPSPAPDAQTQEAGTSPLGLYLLFDVSLRLLCFVSIFAVAHSRWRRLREKAAKWRIAQLRLAQEEAKASGALTDSTSVPKSG